MRFDILESVNEVTIISADLDGVVVISRSVDEVTNISENLVDVIVILDSVDEVINFLDCLDWGNFRKSR